MVEVVKIDWWVTCNAEEEKSWLNLKLFPFEKKAKATNVFAKVCGTPAKVCGTAAKLCGTATKMCGKATKRAVLLQKGTNCPLCKSYPTMSDTLNRELGKVAIAKI